MKGDANPSADPMSTPVASVIGPVVLAIPLLGYLAALLTMPTGILWLILLVLSIVALGAFFDELERGPCPLCEMEPVAVWLDVSGLAT